ncbi:hypothetical protein [Microvirga lenta]|uniref:hypothetical protein n=1 Tax=Microvirga lenta TaxID=2881337 RepID=UPI001CFCC156|nr:hypothetical protein [Microvirga lenta]MCB5174339.1 hypothetical protein [Microvirga lenta]
MRKLELVSGLAAAAFLFFTGSASAQNCSGAPIYFNGSIAAVEGELTVKSGKGCTFNINNIPGAINETVITQKPRVGKAGVQGLTPYYVAKPGYTGSDEFSYTFLGMDQYGGTMRVTFKQKITVVP